MVTSSASWILDSTFFLFIYSSPSGGYRLGAPRAKPGLGGAEPLEQGPTVAKAQSQDSNPQLAPLPSRLIQPGRFRGSKEG